MLGRIALSGATGYTGALTAQAMGCASGVRPILAGRDQSRLGALRSDIELDRLVFAARQGDSVGRVGLRAGL